MLLKDINYICRITTYGTKFDVFDTNINTNDYTMLKMLTDYNKINGICKLRFYYIDRKTSYNGKLLIYEKTYSYSENMGKCQSEDISAKIKQIKYKIPFENNYFIYHTNT